MKTGLWTWLRAQFEPLLLENNRDIEQERGGWDNYLTDIYAAHYRLHDQRRHDRRKQQWKNYERRSK
jgi:hypothetical protein